MSRECCAVGQINADAQSRFGLCSQAGEVSARRVIVMLTDNIKNVVAYSSYVVCRSDIVFCL